VSLLPDPNSLLEQLLLWVGAPIALTIVIMTALTAFDYLRCLMSLSRAGGQAVTQLAALFAERGPGPAVVRLTAAAVYRGIFIAMTYAYARLAEVTLEEDLDDGRLYDTSQVLLCVIDYNLWTPISSNITFAALVLVTVDLVGRLTRNGVLAMLPLALVPIGILSLLLAALAVVPAVFVLLLGLAENEGYTVEMTFLYGLWICVLLGWTFFAHASFGFTDGS
jgi:hypothetical protein